MNTFEITTFFNDITLIKIYILLCVIFTTKRLFGFIWSWIILCHLLASNFDHIEDKEEHKKICREAGSILAKEGLPAAREYINNKITRGDKNGNS